jgi:hypothetical protein
VHREAKVIAVDQEESAPIANEVLAKEAETEVAPLGVVPALLAEDHRIDPPVEARPVEIATGREWAEWTLPPKRWMDRGHCGRDVQW